MAEDEFPVPEGDEGATGTDESGKGLRCGIGDCRYVATGDMAAAQLGLHKFRVHKIRGKTGRGKKDKGGKKSATSTPRQPSSASILRSVESSLSDSATKLGALAYPVLPIPALYLTETADEFAGTVTRIASRNPKLLARLQGTSDAMDYLALGTWIAGLVVAVGVNLGRIPVGPVSQPNPLVAAFGLDKMYAQAEADFGTEPDADGTNDVGNREDPASRLVAASPE